MQDLELYRLTPLFWFDDSLSNRKNLIIEFKKPITLYGSITTAKKVKFKNATVLHYRPASPALTEPFWPINPQ